VCRHTFQVYRTKSGRPKCSFFMITAKRELGHDRIHRLGISPRMFAMQDRMNQVQTPSGTV